MVQLTKKVEISSKNYSNAWIIDSSALEHMMSNSAIFSSYLLCLGKPKIKGADDLFSSVASQGTVKISPTLSLNLVLHVPNLNYNLLSVGKITKDLNCSFEFIPFCCCFKDHLEKTIGQGKLKDGVCYLETDWRNGCPKS